MGIKKGFALAHEGADMRIPNSFRFIMKYISPLFLIVIFVLWCSSNLLGFNLATWQQGEVSGYVRDLFIEPNSVALRSIALIFTVAALLALFIRISPNMKTNKPEDTYDA